MSFLHPALLLALPAVFIPLVIHLLHRRRFQKKSWGAMRFLREAMEEKRGRRKLRHWLLLAMRMLGIAALVLAVSRPLVGGWLAGWLGGGDQTVIVLLDRSASMERRLNPSGPSKREIALNIVGDAWRELRPAELWVHDSASGETRLHETATALSQDLTATDTHSDLPSMLQRALEHWEKTQQAAGELWIVSDLQARDWQADRPGVWADVHAAYAKLLNPPRLRLLSLPGGQANRSIRCRSAQRKLEIAISREPASAQDGETRIPLVLSLDGQQTIHDVSLRGITTTVSLNLPAEGEVTGSVSLPDDGNPQDNQAYFALGPVTRPKVALVCQEPGVGDILQLAAAPSPDETVGLAEIERLPPGDISRYPWETCALLLWQGDLPAEESREMLQHFVETGGQILFFPSAREDGQTAGSWAGIRYGATATRDANSELSIQTWSRDEGPLRNTKAGDILPLSQWITRRFAPLIHAGGSAPRATFSNGEPALLAQALGDGTASFCATLPRDDWSTLGEGLVLVPLVQRLLEAGHLHRSPVDSMAPTRDPWLAGVRLAETGWEVTVRPEDEDVDAEISLAQLGTLLGKIPYQEFSLREGRRSPDSLSDWWRPFLFLALLFLLGESVLTLVPRRQQGQPQAGAP